MALDEPDHRLFIASRTPPRLAVFDTDSGHLLAALPCVQDSDDLYFDATRRRIYVAGGEGYINVFQQDTDHYQPLAKVPSSLVARTAGYSGKLGKKGFDRLYVAVPARANHVLKCGYTLWRIEGSRSRRRRSLPVPLQGERSLSLRRLHGSRTSLAIVHYVIDPSAHGKAPHQPGIARLQQVGRRSHIIQFRIVISET